MMKVILHVFFLFVLWREKRTAYFCRMFAILYDFC